jgi:general secretion pathway protein C
MGDKIQRATIAEIYRKGVVLDINGKKEKLTIAQKADLQERIAPGPVYDPDFASGTARPRPGPAKRVTLDQTRVDNALENLNQLMSEVKIRPYFKDGEASGFIVSNIARDSVVRNMGLKTGDIVTGINGREIKTADDAMAFYEKLRSGETLSIQLKRRGRPETIEYVVE